MGFNNSKTSHMKIIIDHMLHAEPYAKGFDGGWEGADQGHVYTDAVIIHGPYSTWCYHGNPIAQLNRKTGEWKASSCGYDEHPSTRIRLNAVPSIVIYRQNGKSYTSNHELWKDDDSMILPHPTYVRYDAWRGHRVPLTVVCGASNTGNWSDSPCRPEEEIKAFQAFLAKNGIRSTVCWTRTSNVFCIKNWVQVNPKNLDKARLLFAEFMSKEETRLLHAA